jgi:F-type H+/Na+-transporting ATPase subunit alpha
MTQTLPDTLDPRTEDAWLLCSRETIARIDLAPQAEAMGRVERVGDGIARSLDCGRMGFALTLEPDSIGAVLLDDGEAIEAGSLVTGTAEYFRDLGQHTLVVVDDPTKHAATHREVARLTRERPAREAYPGDIFYRQHAT